MEVLEKSFMSDGTKIQIENWSNDYSFMPYGRTIATYPISKATLKGDFSPNLGESFRFALDFNNHDEAKEAFQKLVNGEKQLIDYADNLLLDDERKEEYLKCI